MRSKWRVALALTAIWIPTGGPTGTECYGQSSRELRRTPVVEVFERSRDAVVNIASTEVIRVRQAGGIDRIFEEFFDLPTRPRTRQFRRQSVGSGFVFHSRGYIVTNAHVVAQTTERKVIFADGSEYEAKIIASDIEHDLAILKIDAKRSLPSLPFGRSDDLMVGETVIAIGNALGYQHTVTAGVVSALNRDLGLSPEMSLTGLIQTDASINPGNSGGPLLNVLGQLIGVNTAIRGDAENIGFAIPVDQLRRLLPEMLEVRRSDIETGLSVTGFETPRVQRVVPGSPAAEAGLQAGDVLVGMDGRAIRGSLDFLIGLDESHPGEAISLEVMRDGRSLQRTMELRQRSAPDGAMLARQRLGLEVYDLPEGLAGELGLPGMAGLLVARVEPSGPAHQIGVTRRDVLVAIGRYYVTNMSELGQLLQQVEPGQRVQIGLLRVDRFGKSRLTGEIVAR